MMRQRHSTRLQQPCHVLARVRTLQLRITLNTHAPAKLVGLKSAEMSSSTL